jgi:hypothetical protein
MANRLQITDKPIYMDVFDADATVCSTPITVIRIDLYSAAAGDIFVLEDADGNHVIQIIQETNGRITSWVPSKPVRFNKGLYFDFNDVNSGLDNGTDKLWIYYK